MTREAQIDYLTENLLMQMPQYRAQAERTEHTEAARRALLRGLMNVRPPAQLDAEFLRVQDELLSSETQKRGVVTLDSLPATDDERIYLWKGDITRMSVDAIVNAANSALLGCFSQCHSCIDNVIHSAAGLQLRNECDKLMRAQGHSEPTGGAKLTSGYNLPAKHVIHTVGPIVVDELTEENCLELENCYRACMQLALENGLKSIAFCCISTGVFHFPNQAAAEIAVAAVKDCLYSAPDDFRVVFNVFQDVDYQIYRRLLFCD